MEAFMNVLLPRPPGDQRLSYFGLRFIIPSGVEAATQTTVVGEARLSISNYWSPKNSKRCLGSEPN
jgi:hypothetical protein